MAPEADLVAEADLEDFREADGVHLKDHAGEEDGQASIRISPRRALPSFSCSDAVFGR